MVRTDDHRTTYRADIDGLRALAVLGVVVFHVFPGVLRGGFVGVDVFFVISGFLITKNVVSAGTSINPLDFYARRARRIIPALLVVCLSVAALGTALLLPSELRRVGDSLVAAGAFGSNVLFWLKTNYFEPAAETHPLLHTWSLSVEEQFYLAFPVALHFLSRARLQSGLLLLSAGSLVLAGFASALAPSFAFFMPFTRAWELLAGALLALRSDRHRAMASSSAGLVLLGLSMIAANRGAFPVPWALVPVVGTMMVISSAPSAGSRMLSTVPLVAIGKASYSLYLWHWPLLVLARLFSLNEFSALHGVAVLFGSSVLSWATYRYVEVPMRKRRWSDVRTLIAASAGIVVVIVLGALLRLADGLPSRVEPRVRQLELASLDVDPRRSSCMDKTAADVRAGGLCVVGAAAPPSVLLWGDSHAHALSAGLGEALKSLGVAAQVSSVGSCPPLFAAAFLPRGEAGLRCLELNQELLAQVERTRVTVLLIASWNAMPGAFGADLVSRVEDRATDFAAALRQTVSLLHAAGAQVVVVEEVPGARGVVPLSLARAAMLHREDRLSFSPGEQAQRAAAVSATLDALESEGLIELRLNLARTLCDEKACAVVTQSPLYVDSNHLSYSGSRSLRAALREQLTAIFSSTPGEGESGRR